MSCKEIIINILMGSKEIIISILIGIFTGVVTGIFTGNIVNEKYYQRGKEDLFEKDKAILISYLIKLSYLDKENAQIESVKYYLKGMSDYGEFNGYTANNEKLFYDLYCLIERMENMEDIKQFKDYIDDLGEIIIQYTFLPTESETYCQ